MRFVIGLALSLSLASSALGQIDGTTLRMKYGTPLNRETFRVRPNIEMVVNYGPNGQVCRIELPPGERIIGQAPPSIPSTQQVDEVLVEALPPSIRGREIGRSSIISGINFTMMTEYEHLSVFEGHHGETRTSLSIIFKDEACRTQPPTQ